MDSELIFTNLVGEAVDRLVEASGATDIVIITDTNAAELVLPVFQADSRAAAGARVVRIPAGDDSKNLDTLASIWKSLSEQEATRRTLVINLGGGMVSDIGGFAASTFKRGLRCINVPTTLLGAVDASVGGKTAINFNGLKNQIGTFSLPEAVVLSTVYFNTLPEHEILSGYAEMLKHAMLEGRDVYSRLLAYSPVYPEFDSERLLPLLQESVMTKQRIVASDPLEAGLRKCLNLGHTTAHALEALAMKRSSPVSHGYAVAWGLLVEMIISHSVLAFPSADVYRYGEYVATNYGAFAISCDDYPFIIEAMRQDKKNASAAEINFTLLADIGEPKIDCTVDEKTILSALDIYRDLMKI